MHALTSHDAIQSSRSELKFTIDESRSNAIRDYLGARLRPDPNGVAGVYAVCSVYLDSPDAVLYRQTTQGIRNRYKLRVRIYDDLPDRPAFLEIKRREGSAVKKQRARVDRSVAVALLSGRRASISQSDLAGGDRPTEADWKAFQSFCRLRDRINASGTTYVCYQREAFVSPQNSSWRATFDRHLVASAYHREEPLSIPSEIVQAVPGDQVVFELKFTDRFPHWMQELVRTFNLVSGPFPKYLTCRDRLTPPDISGPPGTKLSRHAGPGTTGQLPIDLRRGSGGGSLDRSPAVNDLEIVGRRDINATGRS